MSWVIDKEYEQSSSSQAIQLGGKARSRALFAKYSLLSGVILIVLGAIVALFYRFNLQVFEVALN
ncbi:MAG: hypothetical protein COA71_10440 [SAR86 cluster bacterium]|uniref:Uncharacterized protein n=1 Tax=SAR86 cluster bacterium TaxID=2030880 RepID=A0A2A5CA76_9GAMM|nr:MAG: hypothetical protein COA71_10440 [SAR86 cluster bacterium]